MVVQRPCFLCQRCVNCQNSRRASQKQREIRRDAIMRQLMSGYQQKDEDMRKLIVECQRRDYIMRQKDENVRQLLSECQRKDEMIMSLVFSLKDQMTILGLAAKSKLDYDKVPARWSYTPPPHPQPH